MVNLNFGGSKVCVDAWGDSDDDFCSVLNGVINGLMLDAMAFSPDSTLIF